MPAPYDPELPSFYELRRLIVAQAERDAAAEQHRPRRQRRRWHGAAPLQRATRRTAVLSGLLVVIASSAWGTSAILRSQGQPGAVQSASSAQTLLEHSGANGRWRVRVWRADGQICDELLVSGLENSACAEAPTGARIRSLSVNGPTRQYVFGLTGPAVPVVDVAAAQRSVRVRTRPLQDADTTGTRWFVTSVARPPGNHTPRTRVRSVQR